jgi:hypothetical protein
MPDTAYARLDAMFERRLIETDSIPITAITTVPRLCGVYLVYQTNVLVYIGSTKNTNHRLHEHTESVTDALLIDETEILFRYAICDDLCARKCIEDRLIIWYAPLWNGLGFGRRPGQSADRQVPSKWDIMYQRILPVGGKRKAMLPIAA